MHAVPPTSSAVAYPRALPKVVAITMAGACLLAPTMAGVVQARDDAGIHAFFAAESQRGALPRTSAQPAAAPATRARLTAEARQRASRLRPMARVLATPPAPRVRFASLPKTDPKSEASPKLRKPKIKAAALDGAVDQGRGPSKPASAPLDLGDPVSALLRDTTLRAGDIVVLPDGLKVFKGDSKGSDAQVEQLRGRAALAATAKSCSQMVLAVAKPVVKAEQEPARYVPQRELAEVAPVQHEARAVRVVYPSTTR